MALASAGLFLEPILPEAPEAQAVQSRYTIIEAQYEPAIGNIGLPWGSAQEIFRGVWDSAFDKYDLLDQAINGIRARSSYWKSTKSWIKGECERRLSAGGNPAWTGYCQDAAVSSWFVPAIGGSITQLGITFNEDERLKIGAFSFAGCSRDPEFHSVAIFLEDIKNEYSNGHCVVVNRSPVRGQDWWGVVQAIIGDNFTISRPTSANEKGIQQEDRKTSTLHNAAVIQSTDIAHPGRAGNFAIFNRDISGLVTGTRWLV